MSIIHVRLPEGEPIHSLPFYLTMEEWLAENGPEGDFFFMWQVNPTVIFGRNQQIDKEVNIEYCKAHGIEFYRRKSGGGCVYADMDNIMFSYITHSVSVQTTFSSYTERVAAMLRSLGLDAASSGRNDVTIKGRKVSGNAFYHIPGRSIVHGTMLFSTDMENMLNAITPSRSKLESKKVKSVASHITTISEHLPDLTIDAFKSHAAEFMADGELVLTPENVEEIVKMSKPYYSERWIYGRSSQSGNYSKTQRIEGAGEFLPLIKLNPEDGTFADINIQGDFFTVGDVDSMIYDKLHGVSPTRSEILKALAGIDISEIIRGLSTEAFVELLIKSLPSDHKSAIH